VSILSEKQILDWKRQYWRVFYLTVADQEFVYRPLSRGELRFIQDSFTDELAVEDYICELCILYPAPFDADRSPAYLCTTLADQILESSGLNDYTGEFMQEKLNLYAAEMDSLSNQMACIIAEAFPQYRLEEIESWPEEKALWYLSRAQYVINELRGGLCYQVLENGIPVERRFPMTFEKKGSEVEEEDPAIARPIKTTPSPVSPKPQAKLPEIPGFDYGLFDPDEMARREKFELAGGSVSDFPELAEIQKFLSGELNPSAEN